jgi:hypothetical protein
MAARRYIRFLQAKRTLAVVLPLALSSVLGAQSPFSDAAPQGSTAAIAGVVHDENGLPVQAIVDIQTQFLGQRTQTTPDGTFQFSGLKYGKYTVCAHPPEAGKPGGDPFVDSCLWHDSTSLVVTVAPGQKLTGVAVPLQHGYPLTIRVNDPAGQLPSPVGKIAGNAFSLHLVGPPELPKPSPSPPKTVAGATMCS